MLFYALKMEVAVAGFFCKNAVEATQNQHSTFLYDCLKSNFQFQYQLFSYLYLLLGMHDTDGIDSSDCDSSSVSKSISELL